MADKEERSGLIRYLIRAALLLVLLLGLLGVVYTSTQPHYTATITRVGDTTSRNRRVRHGVQNGRSVTSYTTTLTVAYTVDGTGEETAAVKVTYTNPWRSPRVGQTLEICHGLNGQMIHYPDNTTRGVAWIAIALSAVCLFISWLIARDEEQRRAVRIRSETDAEKKLQTATETQAVPLNHIKNTSEGVYEWIGEMDEDYQQKNFRSAFRVCVGIALFICVMSLVMSAKYGIEAILPVLLSDAVFMVIVIVVFAVVKRLPGSRQQHYVLREDGLQIGDGKNAVHFSYLQTREIILADTYIELHGKISKPRLYVPPEDMAFVREFLLARIPSDANRNTI